VDAALGSSRESATSDLYSPGGFTGSMQHPF
jgi:hypothetical protein